MSSLLVFDLDNTLIATTQDYTDPILEMCRKVIQVLGEKAPHVSQIVAMEQEIDKRRVRETNPSTGRPYFYSMERFPGSLVETYNQICRKVGELPLPEVQSALYEIGLGAFNERRYGKNLKKGAFEVIEFLRLRGDVAFLLTKGDRRVQEKKIAALKARGLQFDGVCVVDDGEKQERHFSEIAGEFPNCVQRFSVGDSYEFDIAPAIAAGFYGVWLPVETWDVTGRMEELRGVVRRDKCIELASLQDLIVRCDELVTLNKEVVR